MGEGAGVEAGGPGVSDGTIDVEAAGVADVASGIATEQGPNRGVYAEDVCLQGKQPAEGLLAVRWFSQSFREPAVP